MDSCYGKFPYFVKHQLMVQTNHLTNIFVAYILGQVELKEDKRKAGLQSVGNK